MSMSPESRERSIELLGSGATLRETASLVRMSWSDFSREWARAKSQAEAGIESPEADWYRDCAGARAQVRASIRAEAQAEAGSGSRSRDLLAVLAKLEQEDAEEPQAREEGDVRSRSPILSILDKIENETDPIERDRLKQIAHDADMANHALFYEMTRTA